VLPDEPGALGKVMLPIAADGGNLVGLELLERSDGSAVDELMIELPGDYEIDRLRRHLEAIDGVAVEELRPLSPDTDERAHRLISSAIAILETANPAASLDCLIGLATELFAAEWSLLLDLRTRTSLHAHGEAFDIDYLLTLTTPSSCPGDHSGPVDHSTRTPAVLVGELLETSLVLYLGRRLSYRTRERAELAMLARVADRMCRPVRGDRVPSEWVSGRALFGTRGY